MSESLAEFLGATDPRPAVDPPRDDFASLADLTGEEFCRRILDTKEFRQYIMNGIALGDIPPAVITRVMDRGWGKEPERVEHSGPGGQPIVTRVERVVVHVDGFDRITDADSDSPKNTTH